MVPIEGNVPLMEEANHPKRMAKSRGSSNSKGKRYFKHWQAPKVNLLNTEGKIFFPMLLKG